MANIQSTPKVPYIHLHTSNYIEHDNHSNLSRFEKSSWLQIFENKAAPNTQMCGSPVTIRLQKAIYPAMSHSTHTTT
jgi:hypothetical protein